MAAISRENLIVGPCIVRRGAGSAYTVKDVSVRLDKTQFQIRTDGFGVVDHRDDDIVVKATFQPAEYTAASRALCFPYITTFAPGLAVFGTTDTATEFSDTNGHLHAIAASAVTRMPTIRLAAGEPMFGDCEITGIRGVGSDWGVDSSLYTVDATGMEGDFADANFTVASIKQEQYEGVLTGITGFTTIKTENGWTIDNELEISFQKTEELGTARGTLVSMQFMAKCTPLAVSFDDLMAAVKVQGTGFLRGQSTAAVGVDLVITGRSAAGAPVITLKKCAVKGVGYRFGSSVLRDGEVGFVCATPFSSGINAAQFILA